MTALAIGDEQSSLAPTNVLEAQTEDLATAQPGEQHRVDHRPIPIGPERRHELDHVVVVEDPRQMPNRADQRDHPAVTGHR